MTLPSRDPVSAEDPDDDDTLRLIADNLAEMIETLKALNLSVRLMRTVLRNALAERCEAAPLDERWRGTSPRP